MSGAVVIRPIGGNSPVVVRVPSGVSEAELGAAVAAAIVALGGPFLGTATRGAANGVASLDGSSKVPAAQLPALTINAVYSVVSQAAMLALPANVGDVAVRTDLTPHESFMLAASPASTLGNWVQFTADSGAVTAANAYTDGALTTERARADSVYQTVVRVLGAGIDPTGATDSSTAIQALHDAALAADAVLSFPPGVYLMTGVQFGDGSKPVRVVAEGSPGRRLPRPAITSVTLMQPSSSATTTMLSIERGVTMDGITCAGNGAPGTVLAAGADTAGGWYEGRMWRCRVQNGAGIGLDIALADNALLDDVHVDNCGSTTLPSVRVRTISPYVTNVLDLSGVHIEGPVNTALEIAVGTGGLPSGNYAEFLRIHGVHIESGGATFTGGSYNTDALVKIGSIRGVTFVEPFITGGPGPLVSYDDEWGAPTVAMGGLSFIGGALHGWEVGSGEQPTNLVSLVKGDGFFLSGTLLSSCSGAAVTVADTFGQSVFLNPSALQDSCASLLDDHRPSARPVVPMSVPPILWGVSTKIPAFALTRLPTGGLGYATTTRTTGTTFDATERAAWTFLPGGHYEKIAATGAWVVPAGLGAGNLRFRLVGGGGGGGGGGAAALTGGVATQVAGAGGAAGDESVFDTSLPAAATSCSLTIGAGGASVAGGAASTGATGNAGTAGNVGTDTTITISGTTYRALGGGRGNGGAANSTAAVNAGVYGYTGGGTSAGFTPGCGGPALSTLGDAAVPLGGVIGGCGGAPASATNGGAGGTARTAPGQGFTNVTGTTGSTTGGAGTTATQPGCGGGGGGGGAPGGAGGASGAGAGGVAEFWF